MRIGRFGVMAVGYYHGREVGGGPAFTGTSLPCLIVGQP